MPTASQIRQLTLVSGSSSPAYAVAIPANRSRPPLYPILDADVAAAAGWTLLDLATACLAGGATWFQVRAKRAASGWLLDTTAAIVERAHAGGAVVIVNDRADVARLAGADGVHVGQDDLTPAAVRAIVGDTALVGFSTHTPEQIAAAVREPISYLAIGPVFGTSTKSTGYDAVGLDGVRQARRMLDTHQADPTFLTGAGAPPPARTDADTSPRICLSSARRGRRRSHQTHPPLPPLVAIGGITLERASSVMDAGAASVAVISDLLATGDPEARVRAYVERLSR